MRAAAFLFCGVLSAADPCQSGAEALDRRDLAAAEKLLAICIAGKPGTVDPYLKLAGVYQLQKNAEGVYRTASEGLRRFPQERRFYLTVATHDARAKRYTQAIQALGEGARRWPDDTQIRSLLASAYYARGADALDAGRNGPAAADLRRAGQLAPTDVDVHLNLGRALHNLLRHQEALAAFNRVLELNPSTPIAQFHRGLSKYSLGEFSAAVIDLDAEIAANPDYGPAYLIRGLAWMALGDPEKAATDLGAAASRMPDSAQAHHAHGRALIHIGRLQDAEASLRKAAGLDTADPAPLNALVTVLVRLERKDEAAPLAAKAEQLAAQRRAAAPGEIQFRSFPGSVR
jgi:tetratricopeptide (TPR) repeat protein